MIILDEMKISTTDFPLNHYFIHYYVFSSLPFVSDLLICRHSLAFLLTTSYKNAN
jgi:hypothetical protein